MKSVIHLRDKVPNAERRFGSAQHYYPAVIVHGARQVPALFTASDISRAMQRADVNPEDMPVLGQTFWQRFKAWWRGK